MTALALDEAPARPPTADRITGYDLARALAILGMVVVHFGLVLAPLEDADQGWAGAAMHKLDGRAAATFVLLAGIGVTLRSDRAEEPEELQRARRRKARSTLLKRGLFLLAVGFLNVILWPGDILRVYGVSLILAAFFLGARTIWLWTMSLTFILGFVVLLLVFDYEANWNWETLEYRNLWTAAGITRNLFYDGFRSVFPWTGLLFIGMWLGRLDARRAHVRRRMLWWGLAIAIVTEVASAVAVHLWLRNPGDAKTEDIVALAGTLSMPPLPIFLLAAAGVSVAVIALSLMIAERWPAARPVKALVAMGQMAFTWYVVHIAAVGAFVACGWDAKMRLKAALGCGVAFFAGCAGLSALWKRRRRHGPMEWLMRKIAE
jgi:uncharacterized membrane protein YeiB